VLSEQASDRKEDLGERLRSSFFLGLASLDPAPESQFAAHHKVTTRDAGNSI
jgi:hypothetical protein